jgi:hypothetical protein
MNGVELGRAVGVSPQRISQLRQQGLTNAQIAAGERLGRNGRPAVISRPDGGASPHFYKSRSLADLQRAKLAVEVETKQLALAEKKGQLVKASTALFMLSNIVITVRDRLLRVPDELPEQIEHLPAVEIRKRLDVIVRALLDDMQAKESESFERWSANAGK